MEAKLTGSKALALLLFQIEVVVRITANWLEGSDVPIVTVARIDKEGTVCSIAYDQVATGLFAFSRLDILVLVIVWYRHIYMVERIVVPLVAVEDHPGLHTNDARTNFRRRDGKCGIHDVEV